MEVGQEVWVRAKVVGQHAPDTLVVLRVYGQAEDTFASPIDVLPAASPDALRVESLNGTISELIAYRFELREAAKQLLKVVEEMPAYAYDERGHEAYEEKVKATDRMREILSNTALASSSGAGEQDFKSAKGKETAMIENSYVKVESDGKTVSVRYFEDGELREGPATFPARYPSFAGICAYINTQFGMARELGLDASVEIQGLLGSPWPAKKLRFDWNLMPRRPGDQAEEATPGGGK